MNRIPPSGRPTFRRWFLSLLATRPARRLLHHTLLAILALNLAAPSWAGSDFQVNTYTTGVQHNPAVALDNAGNFVVVWESDGSAGNDTDGDSIQGQRYDSAGIPQGSQFQVNTYTFSDQYQPDVALDSDGDFVVVWRSLHSNHSDFPTILGQRYNSVGTPQGSEFPVYTQSDFAWYPAVSMDSDGDFVVVWQEVWSYIQGQRYNSVGVPQGSNFQVDNDTTVNRYPDVALDSDGDFVVAWLSYQSPGSDNFYTIQARRFNSLATPQADQFQVNTYTTDKQRRPAVATDNDGDFVVVWMSNGSPGSDTSGESIQGQRYNAAGTPQGSQFQVNTYTTGDQLEPDVALDDDGDFVVVWYGHDATGSDSSGHSIQGQLYNHAGLPQGTQFQVNTYTTSDQSVPAVALDSSGNFVIAWASNLLTADLDWGAIAARRFSLQPTDVSLVNLQPAAPTPSLPTLATLLALLTALATLLTAAYRRLRHHLS